MIYAVGVAIVVSAMILLAMWDAFRPDRTWDQPTRAERRATRHGRHIRPVRRPAHRYGVPRIDPVGVSYAY